jgi:hypothetical protein
MSEEGMNMNKNSKTELRSSRLSLVFFAIAIVLAFKHSHSIAIDQQARNQAQAHENLLHQLENPNEIIQHEDSDTIKGIKQALDHALGQVS